MQFFPAAHRPRSTLAENNRLALGHTDFSSGLFASAVEWPWETPLPVIDGSKRPLVTASLNGTAPSYTFPPLLPQIHLPKSSVASFHSACHLPIFLYSSSLFISLQPPPVFHLALGEICPGFSSRSCWNYLFITCYWLPIGGIHLGCHVCDTLIQRGNRAWLHTSEEKFPFPHKVISWNSQNEFYLSASILFPLEQFSDWGSHTCDTKQLSKAHSCRIHVPNNYEWANTPGSSGTPAWKEVKWNLSIR